MAERQTTLYENSK